MTQSLSQFGKNTCLRLCETDGREAMNYDLAAFIFLLHANMFCPLKKS